MQSSVKVGQIVNHFQHGFGVCKDGTDSTFILVAFKAGSERRVSIQNLVDEDGHSFATPVGPFVEGKYSDRARIRGADRNALTE